MEEVERVTGMDYEEAMKKYDMTQIAPSSENLKNHYKRLGKDNEYRKKWKTAVSSKVEKQQRDIEHELFKTFAEKL